MDKKLTHGGSLDDTYMLLKELDALVSRRPNEDPILPPLLFLKSHKKDTSSAQLIANNYWVSSNVNKPAIPHTLSLLDQPHLDDISLFMYIYENLKIPHAMGKFRFTNLKMAIALLGQTVDPEAISRDDKIEDLVTKLHYTSHSRLIKKSANLLSNSNDSYDGILGFAAIILEAFRRLRFKLFRTKLATTKRYRWLTDRVALELTRQQQIDEVSQDFLSCALWLLERPYLKNSALMRELLMLALFEDLEKAYKHQRRSLSWHRRRRTTPFVITIKDVAVGDSAGRRFLQTFGELMVQSKGTALLIIASVNGTAPTSLFTANDSFHTAADKLRLIREGRYESLSITAFNIKHPAPAKEQEIVRQFVTERPAPKSQVTRQDFTLVSMAAILLLPFVIAGFIYALRAIPIIYQSTQQCKYMRVEEKEVIGITDGSCSFLTKNDARSIDYSETSNFLLQRIEMSTDKIGDLYTYIRSLGSVTSPIVKPERLSYIREINDTKNIILAQNKLIKDEDYRTIALILPFTSPDESGNVNQKTIGIIRGVAVAQEEINNNAEKVAKDDPEHLKLKILIANTGNKLAYGVDVARDIRDLNKNGLPRLTPKHSIIAVAGITQSTAPAKRTVNVLTKLGTIDDPAIPVIGSTLTYDYMSDGDPLFYQAAAPSKRQAKVLAEFIRRQPMVGDVSANVPDLLHTARNMVIVSNDNDWYSQNLADDIYNEFTINNSQDNSILRSWSIKMGNDQDSDPHLKYKAESLPLSTIQSQLCNPTLLPEFDQMQDIVIYTGRSQNFSTFLNSLKPDVCARGKGFTILAGSDIAQWGEYDKYKNFFPYLYFGAFGSRDSDHNGAVADNFFANSTVKNVIDQSGAARAYDSIKLIWSVTPSTTLQPNEITTATLAAAFLAKPSIQFEGASGVLSIPSGEQVPINKPVFIMRAGSAQPVLSCGAFSIQPPGSELRLNTHGQPFIETGWGSERQFNCP